MTYLIDPTSLPAREIADQANEWYTPAAFLDAARRVMGGEIDLDPASCAYANRVVRAARYFSLADNGLAHPWHAERLWLNPPYGRINGSRGGSRSWQGAFVKYLLREHQCGHVQQAIVLLLGNSCFCEYYQPLWAFPACFYDGVISFEKADGSAGHFGFGTIFVYLGPHKAAFIEAFGVFGPVVERVSAPPSLSATPITLFEETLL